MNHSLTPGIQMRRGERRSPRCSEPVSGINQNHSLLEVDPNQGTLAQSHNATVNRLVLNVMVHTILAPSRALEILDGLRDEELHLNIAMVGIRRTLHRTHLEVLTALYDP
jgi:hypothetical protein